MPADTDHTQLIAFIRRGIFCDNFEWLAPVAEQLGIGGIGDSLDDGASILYVMPHGSYSVGKYDEDRANGALYLIVPDENPNWVVDGINHQPSVVFKYLYHSQTNPRMFAGYWNLSNCVGSDRSMHATGENNPYHWLAREIKKIANGDQPDPKPLLGMITERSWLDEQAIKLLNLLRSPDEEARLISNLGGYHDKEIMKLLNWNGRLVGNWIETNGSGGKLKFEELRDFLEAEICRQS